MSAGSGYAAALALGGVFFVAAVAKLRRPAETKRALRELGLPAASVAARAVPLFECGLTALLVFTPRVGATVAIAALAAFTAAVAPKVRTGAGCGCFGGSPRPLSYVEIVRNALLAGLATAALVAPQPVVPRLEEVVLVGTACVAGVVLLALCALRRDVGAVWDNRLAGEL